MFKLKPAFFVLPICVICFLISVISSYASDESLTITTYYPSPYGSYRELRSQMMAIGTNYYSGSYTCWSGGSCTYPIPAAASLIVEGNVGIGTTSPAEKLHVSGGNVLINNGGALHLQQSGSTGYSDIRQGQSTGALTLMNYDAGPIYFGTHTSKTQANTRLFIANTGNIGIGTIYPEYTLTVNGTAWVASGAWSGSDIRWKKNIKPLENSLRKILQLQGVNFDWRKDEFLDKKFPSGVQIGFIAQDVEKVFPEVVTTDNNGYKGISYERLVPILTEAIQEQQKGIEDQQKQIDELKTEIKELKARR